MAINLEAESIRDFAVSWLTHKLQLKHHSSCVFYGAINQKSPSPEANTTTSDCGAYSITSSVMPTSQSPLVEPSLL